MRRGYHVPTRKYELVDFLSKRYPKDRPRFQKMGKRQLYAIYFSYCDRATKEA